MNTQLEHDASASRNNCSQCDRILSLLHEAGEGTWVAMPMIAREMSPTNNGQGNCPPRRILDLRRKIKADGWNIRNCKFMQDGVWMSFYRLVRIGSPLDVESRALDSVPYSKDAGRSTLSSNEKGQA